jgi:hypothetical protein
MSKSVPSPDGNWIAVAESEQFGGPGNAYDDTTVSLKWVKNSDPATQILLFSHQFATMNLTMEWVDPTHLLVKYGEFEPRDRITIEFQAVKCGGVEIALQHLPFSAADSRNIN